LQVRKLRTQSGGIGAADLGQALDFFDRTEAAQASAIIARWRRESAREALTESEDAVAVTAPEPIPEGEEPQPTEPAA